MAVQPNHSLHRPGWMGIESPLYLFVDNLSSFYLPSTTISSHLMNGKQTMTIWLLNCGIRLSYLALVCHEFFCRCWRKNDLSNYLKSQTITILTLQFIGRGSTTGCILSSTHTVISSPLARWTRTSTCLPASSPTAGVSHWPRSKASRSDQVIFSLELV